MIVSTVPSFNFRSHILDPAGTRITFGDFQKEVLIFMKNETFRQNELDDAYLVEFDLPS